MNVSQVKVGQSTLDNNRISGQKKTQLRRKLIVELIESKPAGQVIRLPEFQAVGHFSTSANAHAFVQRMVRDGIIAKYSDGRPRSYYFAVLGKVRTTSKASPVVNHDGVDLDKLIALFEQLDKQSTVDFSVTVAMLKLMKDGLLK